MPLSDEQVGRLAQLARLEIPGAAIDGAVDNVVNVARDLNSIFELIAQMQAVDTTGIEPMSHPQDLAARLREDSVTEANHRTAFQALAPQAEAGLYLVPKVVE